MCGIVASFGPNERDERACMLAALGTLAHRGPDGEGLVRLAGGCAWLGHRRLALVDLEGGAQPIANEDESVWAVVNGEIYDDARMRRELEARGHRFRSRSDSEVLVHLYEESGAGALERLEGELAFVLFDASEGRILAGRDRFGIKPLLWAEHAGRLLIASEAKALFALGLPAQWSERGVLHAVAHQYLPPGRTLFRGVSSLLPGCRLEARLRTGPTVLRYHQLQVPSRFDAIAPTLARDEIRSRLERAVRLRLRADVPVGVYLSGGLDSASILALAAREQDGLRAFGVAFEHPPYDEGAMAARTAAHVGIPFEQVLVRQQDLVEALPEAVRFAEGLAINGQLVAKHLLARAARAAGVRAVLTGEGADEAFLGYPHLRLDYLGPDAERAADALTRGVMIPCGDTTLPLGALQSRLGFIPNFLRAKAAFGARLAGLLHPGSRVGLDGVFDRLLDDLAAGESFPVGHAPPVTVSSWLWTRLALAGYILRTLGDGTEMAHSIEGRPPFLDHALFERGWTLPVGERIDKTGREKAILRDAVADLVPHEVYVRPKHPFLAPPVLAFGQHVDSARQLLHEVVGFAPFFDADAVKRWIDALATAEPQARAAAEPAWTMITTAGLLGRELGLAYRGEERMA